jgi:BAAT / Acyl-CoA thioester hydrolase C terminal
VLSFAPSVEKVVDDPKLIYPVERGLARYLFFVSEDDKCSIPVRSALALTHRLEEHGLRNYEIVSYPATGHLLEPPHMPHCGESYHKVFRKSPSASYRVHSFLFRLIGRQRALCSAFAGGLMAWGGNAVPHCRSQVDMWSRLIGFFHETLGSPAESSKL